MSLSCECGDGDVGDVRIFWDGLTDYTTLVAARRVRCCSCKELIGIGAVCVKAYRFRVPRTDIEIRIHGDDGEIRIPPKHLCERCADILFSLEDLGFCVKPWEDQRELLAEYVQMHGAKERAA